MTTASGATAVQVVAKEGRRNKILEHLGSAHTEAELAVLMRAGRDKLNAGQETLDLGLEQDPQAAVVRSLRSRLLLDVLQATWRGLGFDALEDEAFFQLVAARLIFPTSMTRGIAGGPVQPSCRRSPAPFRRRSGQSCWGTSVLSPT
ncbi:hypothetical protein D641_0108930 [Brachybacterium muris UCD-AY4]|uniref:Uncharacterized protein n=1 Tax=Brachybacterium muris UCD-AY4 TaxID=1249481 RepID=A0A022KWG8_9MICO|nr:hypothetical protein D641_0108930 [Brachybacterium muris UCD-AY4]